MARFYHIQSPRQIEIIEADSYEEAYKKVTYAMFSPDSPLITDKEGLGMLAAMIDKVMKED